MTRRPFSDAIADLPYSRSEWARRADISRTTIASVAEDPSRARLSTLREMALALGYDIVVETERASDPIAAAAARILLADLPADAEIGAPAAHRDAWMERLRRYSGATERVDPVRIITEAAHVSGAHHRDGNALFAGRNDTDRLISVGRASGARWALSGAASLDAMGVDSGATVVMWTDDVKTVADLLTDTHRRVRLHSAADVIVAPAHPSVFVGAALWGDAFLVSPVQGIIDAVSLGGDEREAALALLSAAAS